MPPELLALAGQAGVTGGIVWAMVYLHRQAIRAYREMVATWRAVAELHSRRADEAVSQVLKIVEAVRAGADAGAGAGAP